MATDDMFEYEDDELEALLGEEEGLEGDWEEELFGEEGFGDDYELEDEFEEEYESMDYLLKGVGKGIAATAYQLIRKELRRRGVTGRSLVAAARRVLKCVMGRVLRNPTVVFSKSALLRMVVRCVTRLLASPSRARLRPRPARKRARAA